MENSVKFKMLTLFLSSLSICSYKLTYLG